LVDETIEEAFDRIYNSIDFTEFDFTSFKLGVKWEQQSSCEHNYILTTEQGHRVIKCLKCDNIQPI
jgi:PHP family Zn ribbon phosphoesterase